MPLKDDGRFGVEWQVPGGPPGAMGYTGIDGHAMRWAAIWRIGPHTCSHLPHGLGGRDVCGATGVGNVLYEPFAPASRSA